jgi:hypothetical protein
MSWREDQIRQSQQQLRVQCASEIPRPAGEGAGLRNDADFLARRAGAVAPHGVSSHNLLHFVPWIMGVAEDYDASRPRRFSPKKMGEMSQAAFLLKAQSLGFGLAVPWGDSEKCDFVVWAGGGGRLYRVQVKGTGRLHRGGYDVQPVYSTRGEGKKSYTAEEIDVLAARVVIEGSGREVWYLLPASVVEGVKNLRLFPELKGKNPRWEGYREAWEWLGG